MSINLRAGRDNNKTPSGQKIFCEQSMAKAELSNRGLKV